MMTRTERDKMLAGDLYDAGAPELQADAAAAHEWLVRYNAAFGTPISERRELLLERLAAVGEGAVIRPPFHCDYGFNISLGAGGRADSDFGRADLGTRCCHRGAGHGRDRAARGGADDLHHRPSAVDSAALRRIVVLRDGAIAEEGTLPELLRRDGIFAQYYRTQFAPEAEHAAEMRLEA